ncbi:sensory box histidine kinase/response regulator [Caldimonas brevitalea]|uniref:histidine kinase n=1 Tax=Caldimonas brevitalea TaxID=413882 RepID=A0A0G3BEL6_9BURK|nr:sensory box histidine kinase/response regulator [Caldimonas brevitalea]
MSGRWLAYARVAGVVGVLICAGALFGWLAGWPWQVYTGKGLQSLRPTAALCFGLVSLGVVWRAFRCQGPAGLWLPLSAVLLAGVTIVEHLIGAETGLHRLLVQDRYDGHGLNLRMPIHSAVGVALLGLSLVAGAARSDGSHPWWSRLAAALAVAAVAMAYITSVGMLLDTRWEGSPLSDFASLSLPAATLIVLLGIASIALRAERTPLLAAFAPSSAASRFFRAVLPLALLFPVLTGWLRLAGQRAGWYGDELGAAWMVLMSTLLFVGVAFVSTRWISRFESALKASHATLEQRVEERTAQLAEAMERVRESEERFRFMAEAAPALIWMTDADGDCSYVNSTWLQYTGHALAEELGQGWMDNNVHPADRERVLRTWLQSTEARRTFRLEYRLRRHDGQYRWIVSHGTPRIEGAGRFAGYVGTCADIHDAKSTALALQASREQLASIVDSATIAIISLDASHRIVLFNAAAEKIFQVSAARMLSRTLDVLLPERFRTGDEAVLQAFERSAANAGQKEGAPQLWGLRANGEEFPLEVSISRVDSDGVRLVTVVLRDMSEVYALEAERRARAAAEEASRAKSLFLSHLSHELRTPLNAVIGFSQLLLATAPQNNPKSNQHQYAGYILQAGQHLLAMINDLLDLSRIEAGQTQLQMRAVDLGASVQHSLQLVAPQAQSAGVTVQVSSRDDAGTPLVLADEARLRQVLVNLLSNAIKYNRPHGHVEVDVSRYDEDDLAVEVRDTGFGMSPEQLDNLFTPFSRLGREHSDIEGTGIGLSLSKRLIEMMGGRIEVRSTPEQGSTFTAVLKAAPASPDAAG